LKIHDLFYFTQLPKPLHIFLPLNPLERFLFFLEIGLGTRSKLPAPRFNQNFGTLNFSGEAPQEASH